MLRMRMQERFAGDEAQRRHARGYAAQSSIL